VPTAMPVCSKRVIHALTVLRSTAKIACSWGVVKPLAHSRMACVRRRRAKLACGDSRGLTVAAGFLDGQVLHKF